LNGPVVEEVFWDIRGEAGVAAEEEAVRECAPVH
jgi:hypothetical protein